MSEIDESAVEKLFTIKRNQLKMVRRRGYNIEKQEENILSVDLQSFLDVYIPFAKKEKKSLRKVLSRPYTNDEGEKILVFYADVPRTKQLGVEEFKVMIETADKHNAKNLILITPVNLSSAVNKNIQELEGYNIYVFLENEMTYDPTEHYFTPEHKALGVEEQREFLKRNNLSLEQLPIILTSDMMVRYYGFRPGQIIEINRTNLYDAIVQNSLSYRAVKTDL